MAVWIQSSDDQPLPETVRTTSRRRPSSRRSVSLPCVLFRHKPGGRREPRKLAVTFYSPTARSIAQPRTHSSVTTVDQSPARLGDIGLGSVSLVSVVPR
jgi:hypothetical protein